MSRVPFSSVLHYLRRLGSTTAADQATDGQLLERFVKTRDAGAFTTLVQRHGPLVWNLCQRVLGPVAEAEDAFQATFLILVRKAGSVGKRESVRSWLYGVAYRVAVRARSDLGRRRARELPLDDVPAGTSPESPVWRDLRPILDEEINRLPAKHRLAVILCYLEGKTNDEAAQFLGCPRGSVATYLSRARERLRGRLARRGLALSATALSALLADNANAALPLALVDTTVQTALLFASDHAAIAGGLSLPAVALAEGVLHTMFKTKLSLIAVVLLALTALGSGAGVLTYGARAAQDGAGANNAPARPEAPPATTAAPDRSSTGAPVAGTGGKPAEATAIALIPPRDALARNIDFQGLDDLRGTLGDALEFFSQFQLNFDINETAFKAEGVEDVMSVPVPGDRPLTRLKNVSLARVLTKVLSRVQAESGATYVLRGNIVEITTKRALRAELGIPDNRPLLPLVQVNFVKQPLDEALRELAKLSGFNVVLDSRVAAAAVKAPVSAEMINVPVDTAVRLLADMADLKPVLRGNVLYVTTKENAQRLQVEQDKRMEPNPLTNPCLGGGAISMIGKM